MIGKLLLIMSLLIGLSACGDDVAYRIKGNLENLKDEKIYAVFENANSQDIDTVSCEKPGEFKIEKKTGDFDQVTFLWNKKHDWFTVFLEKGKEIHISGDALYPQLLQIKGGKINHDLTEMHKNNAELFREQTDLCRSLEAPEISSIEKADVMARIANVNLQIDEAVMSYITDHPERKASLVLTQQYFMNPEHWRYLDKALTTLSSSLTPDPLYKELSEYNTRLKRTIPGSKAPAFSVKNIYGKRIALKDIKDKEILLLFTAPWTDIYLSKQILIETFSTDFSKDYEIIIVSLDTDPQQVRKLVSKSKIHWNIVTDSASQASQLLDLYNVSSLPRYFLIDKEHNIKVKTDSGEEIRKKIAESQSSD